MMVEDVIRGQLQSLPSSSPPSCPSWSAAPHLEQAKSMINPLRSISEVSPEDYSGVAVAEDAILTAGVRSLKLRKLEGRYCLGLTLGVLVPLALAGFIILRSAGMGQAQHHTDTDHTLAGLARNAHEGNGKLAASASISGASASHADWRHAWDSSMSTTKKSMAKLPGLLDDAMSDVSTSSVPASTAEDLPSQESKQPVVKLPAAPAALLRGSGRPVLQSTTPWYSYFVYAFCAVTAIAWIALGVNECRTRSHWC